METERRRWGGRLLRTLRSEHVPWIFVIFTVALLLRGVWAGYAAVDPNDGRFDDSVFYHNVAISLARRHEFTHPYTGLATAQWPPGYPFFLAGIYFLFGPTLAGARIANVALGAGTAVLVYLLGLRLFERRTARLGALLTAVFPGQVLFAAVLYSEVLFTFLFVLALLLIVLVAQQPARQRPAWLVSAGIVSGAAALVRGQGLVLPLAALATWLLLARGWRPALEWTAVILGLMAVVIAPWAVRNYLVMDSPILITSSFGGNFYVGNNKDGLEGVSRLLEEYGPLTVPGAEVKVGDEGLREGLRFLATHPRDELRMTGEKIRDLYRGDSAGLRLVESYGAPKFLDARIRRSLEGAANGFYFLVLALAGLVLAVRCRHLDRAVLQLLLVIGLWTLGSVVFFADTRFHFPVIPLFCLLAGGAAAAFPRGKTTDRDPPYVDADP